jgi:hypothetical protein
VSLSLAGNGTVTGFDAVASGFGKVLQVVSAVKTDTFTTTSTSYTNVTGLTVTITPSANTNRVFVIAQFVSAPQGTSELGFFRLNGGNASTYVGDAAGSRDRTGLQVYDGNTNDGHRRFGISQVLSYLDSPATTSPVTYAVQAKRITGTIVVGRSGTDTDDNGHGRFGSSIIAIEVAA